MIVDESRISCLHADSTVTWHEYRAEINDLFWHQLAVTADFVSRTITLYVDDMSPVTINIPAAFTLNQVD